MEQNDISLEKEDIGLNSPIGFAFSSIFGIIKFVCDLFFTNWKMIGLTFLIMYIIEYICFKTGVEIKPSAVFKFIYHYLKEFFQNMGKFCAWISSFLTFIEFEELVQVAKDLFEPIFDILLSWIYFFKGYIDKAMLYVNKNVLVYIGSIILIGIIYGLICYFGFEDNLIMWMNRIIEFWVSK